jgi:hypothetical protein
MGSVGSGEDAGEAYGLYAGGLSLVRWLFSGGAWSCMEMTCMAGESWPVYAVRMVVSEVLRVMAGGDVGRKVYGSMTSSRFTICIAGGGDITRPGDEYPEPRFSEWTLPVWVCAVPVV